MIGGHVTVIVADNVSAQLLEVTACTWKLNTPGTSGVPETKPLVASTSPGGKKPLIKENVTSDCRRR